jgi:hypothetical protein
LEAVAKPTLEVSTEMYVSLQAPFGQSIQVPMFRRHPALTRPGQRLCSGTISVALAPKFSENTMEINALKAEIETAWASREGLGPATAGAVRSAITAALDMLDAGAVRVAEKTPRGWVVNEWLKKAV